MRSLPRLFSCVLTAAAAGWAQTPPTPPATISHAPTISESNAYDTPEGVAKGGAIFATQCAYCHGAHGEGGRGADLTSGQYTHGNSNADLFSTIRNGVPGTSMPPASVNDEQVWQLVALVRRLGSPGLYERATGDSVAGKTIFESKGKCLTCHSVGLEGGSLGPDLSDVGRRRTLSYLQESIVKPDADVPIRYRAIRVVTTPGEAIAGIRLNEDDVSIQLRDAQDRLRCFMKDDLKDIQHEKASLMPSYASVLSGKEIEDLVAYLNSLRVAP